MALLSAGRTPPRYATVRNNTAQTITNLTSTALAFQVAVDDDQGWWSSGSNTRITPDADAALIWCGQNVVWAGHSTGIRQGWVGKNGAIFAGNNRSHCYSAMPDANTFEQCNWYPPMPNPVPGTDYYEMFVRHNRGANLNVNTDSTWFSILDMGVSP